MSANGFDAWWAFCQRPENDGQPLHVTPGDEGGATAFGITFATYQEHAVSVSLDPSRDAFETMTQDQAAMIAKAGYWAAVRADEMPAGADLIWTDFSFMSGGATRQFQSWLGVYVDGQVGPVTLKALQDDWNTRPAAVLQEMTSVRVAYYKSLGQPEFVNGWIRRANDCYAAALAMISPPVQS